LCAEIFKFCVSYDEWRNKEWQDPKLGDAKAPQGNIQGRPKQLSLGMPRKASPLSSSTLLVTSLGTIFLFVTWYVFCLEHHFILFVFACCYLKQCFASFVSIKMPSIAFTLLSLQVYVLLFENRKFSVMSRIFLNSQNMLKIWNFYTASMHEFSVIC
jgi:hypothetical protein